MCQYRSTIRNVHGSTILDGPRAERLLEASRSKSVLTYGAVASTRMVTKAGVRAKARARAKARV